MNATWLPIPWAVLVSDLAFGWRAAVGCLIGIFGCWVYLAVEGRRRYGP